MTIAENIRVSAEIAGGWTKERLAERVDELINIEDLRACHFAFDRHLPWTRFQSACVCRRIALIGTELVEVVVVGDGVVRVVLLSRRVVEVPRNGERGPVIRPCGVRALFVVLSPAEAGHAIMP